MNRRRREASAGVRSKKCGENNNNLTKLGLAAREGITNGFTNRESESFTVYGFSQITIHSYDVTTSIKATWTCLPSFQLPCQHTPLLLVLQHGKLDKNPSYITGKLGFWTLSCFGLTWLCLPSCDGWRAHRREFEAPLSALFGLEQRASITTFGIVLHVVYPPLYHGRYWTAICLGIVAALLVELGAAAIQVVDQGFASGLVEAGFLET